MFLKCYRERRMNLDYDIKIIEMDAKYNVEYKAGEWKYTLENSKKTAFRVRAPQTFFSF